MNLISITEPNSQQPDESNNDLAIGIDLGTTHSLVAYSNNGKVTIFTDAKKNKIIASMVAYNGDKIIVGNEVKDLSPIKQQYVVTSVKRFMGMASSDISNIKAGYEVIDDNKIIKLQIADKQITAIEVASEILKHLKAIAEAELDREVSKAVITVPAHFDDAARAETKDAAKLAGLEVLRLINEPTAAALAYGLDKQAEGIYAIYDLGGGTFDISILKMDKGVFRVLATSGDMMLGGDDFDRKIAEYIIDNYKLGALDNRQYKTLLATARILKEDLTENIIVTKTLRIADKIIDIQLSRVLFEKLIIEYVTKTLHICNDILHDADLDIADITGVVLVGGATRVPLVYQQVAKLFEQKPLTDINPDEIVAIGAAIQAEGLIGGSDNLLLDVIPLSLAIETMGGLADKIIHRNSAIPVSKAQEFTTYQDGQTAIEIHIVQGEREMVKDCRSLAKFTLRNIPPMKAGIAKITVILNVDADGLLTISAMENTTGIKQDIEVNASYGLDEEQIKAMLLKSMEYGKADMEQRLLTETKVEAEQLILAIQSVIKSNPDIINTSERKEANQAITALNKAISSNNRDAIIEQQKNSQKIVNLIAEKQLQHSFNQKLSGMNMADLKKIVKEDE